MDTSRSLAGALRHGLARMNTLPRLSLLAIVSGLLAGGVVVLFRAALQGAGWLTGNHGGDNFEALSPALQVLLPVFGAFAIGVAFNRLPADERRLGVVHVIERLASRQGRLSWRGAWRQFAGAVVGLTAGLSGGREGPAVHLGAASSSLLGAAAELPEDGMRTLVACGSAAAIGASFNTPLAGVVFAMEVVLMEYTIVGFIPVILATATATVVNRWAFGDITVLETPTTDLRSLLEVPYIVFVGVAVGVVGGVFIALVKSVSAIRAWPFWLRATAAGALTGAAAWFAPEVLGTSYDTINEALLGNIAGTALLVILVAKVVASAACVGVGLPVGVIAPTLVIGALAGGLLGEIGNAVMPEHASAPALYVMLGMAAMMAAVLQAPLAALTAVLELTANPNIILPAMLVIVAATLTVREVFKQRSLLLTTLAALGIDYRGEESPPRQAE